LTESKEKDYIFNVLTTSANLETMDPNHSPPQSSFNHDYPPVGLGSVGSNLPMSLAFSSMACSNGSGNTRFPGIINFDDEFCSQLPEHVHQREMSCEHTHQLHLLFHMSQ